MLSFEKAMDCAIFYIKINREDAMNKKRTIATMTVCLIFLGAAYAEDACRADSTPSEKKTKAKITDFKDWAQTDFAGRASVRVDDEGTVFLEKGNDMTGVTWKGPLRRMDYEITLEAKRVDGGRHPGRPVLPRLQRRLQQRNGPLQGIRG